VVALFQGRGIHVRYEIIDPHVRRILRLASATSSKTPSACVPAK